MTVDSLPKVELHVHLEGTATPELVQRLAARNGMALPERLLNEHGRFHYGDFLDFLRTYDMAASVIRTAEDYRDITYEYLRDCAAEGAIYVELTASPDHARLVGLTDEEHLDGISRGIDDARRLHGIEGRILISAVRNFGLEQALAVARYAAAETAPLRRRVLHGRRRGELPHRRLRRALRDRRRGRTGLHGPRRRVGGPRERARGAHAAGHPDRPRGPRHRGSCAGGRARLAAHRAQHAARRATSCSGCSPGSTSTRCRGCATRGCG